MSKQDSADQIKELLGKLFSLGSDDGDECDMPNIAKCSIRIEHQKYKIAKLMDKEDFLILINLTKLNESNAYAAMGQYIENDKSIDEIMDEMQRATKSYLKSLRELLEEIKK